MEELEKLEQIGSKLFRMKYGAGGQSIPLQMRQQAGSELGKKILSALKEYREQIAEIDGEKQ